MTDIYEKLARHLDHLPAGFPATESGVELRILRRLFSEEEAGIAMQLTMRAETPADIARKMDRDAGGLAPVLEKMARKGLIFRSKKDGQARYSAAQFVVGIWEYHVNDLSEDLVRDMNEYIPHLIKKSWIKHPTKQLRVVPVTQSVSAEMKVMPYEQAEEIISSQSKIVVAPCICRREHELIGEGCGKLMEACLIFGASAYYYEENNLGRTITQDEAREIINQGLSDGLVLQPGNSRKPSNICLCCGCCCQILKNLKTLEKPAKAVSTSWVAAADEDLCTACSVCVDRCQMDAITVDDHARVDPDRCIGCGLCVPTCEYDAMALHEIDADKHYVPPRNTVATYLNLARDRGLI
ncbi:MAG: 4Fe-4S ferredoxin [Deltaproteobacteria bacterium]|nr:MAG: 4Fe-4S ferredoxin [Deltaproteobacteria bacterium]RUA02772.1 MAG: 4Fe-4S ferredoxin [Deltaproteobacteria bacterium]